jgi:hypothetical protein
MPTVSEVQIRWFRLCRSGLVRSWADPEEAAARLAGVQAQILSAACLALWNRSAVGATTEAEVSHRLFEQRSLVRLWGQRKTLHLFASADWPLIHAAFRARQTWWERDAAKDPAFDLASYQAGIARVADLLRERGTLSRKELRAANVPLPAELYSPWGGVFAELVRIGEACHARWNGGEARYAHRTHWLVDLPWTPPSTDEANVTLARRYFSAYGPATKADFTYWRGGAAGESRKSLDAIATELEPVSVASDDKARRTLYILRTDLPALLADVPEPAGWPVRMLGRFDPLLLAHRDKDWVVPSAFYKHVWRPAGHIEAVVLAHGRAVATWRYDRTGAGGLAVRVFPFRWPLAAAISKQAKLGAREVARFFGLRLLTFRVERRSTAPVTTQ